MQRDLAEQRGWRSCRQPGRGAGRVGAPGGGSEQDPGHGFGLLVGLAGAVPADPLIESLLGPFEQGAPPGAPALAVRGLSPVFVLEPGEVVVLAEFGCDLVEAAPLAF